MSPIILVCLEIIDIDHMGFVYTLPHHLPASAVFPVVVLM